MNNIELLSAFLIGFAGSTHCVGMCGGIVGALSLAIPKQHAALPYILFYNLGRISSYTLAGAITGYLGVMFGAQIKQGMLALQLLSGFFLLLLAFYIGGWWNVLHHFEKVGQHLWRRLMPLGKALVPFRSPITALPYGMLWGWLPCGLVYSTLVWSLASGSAVNGALTMLFFGLGTLPALITMGVLGQAIKQWLSHPQTRQIMAVLLFIFSCYLLIKAFITGI
ncbi:sulfite exporter TauE/SafE family protein [Alteromonadaceae bacterium BrNp21-10]|nr:sulfite exporter TauE/SafE family protein [Alteromonadaceae bacterium BrNp21-10]